MFPEWGLADCTAAAVVSAANPANVYIATVAITTHIAAKTYLVTMITDYLEQNKPLLINYASHCTNQ